MYRFVLAISCLSLVQAPAQDEMEDNFEYKAWAKVKPGSWVKWSSETNTGAMKMTSDITWRLKELAADKAVVEETTSVNLGGKMPTEHTSLRTVPAKIKKGTTADGAKVEPSKFGDEELTIKGRAIKCHWEELKLTGQARGTMKIWRTDEIVGGAARISIKHDDAAKMTMTMTVTDWDTKN